ncbi:MAG: dTDP-4-dehydrorhamnose 3,5-epimerase [candidate division WS1 bacterium]|nr:dTDP-4-dehydrorhamnose 3,5-epimerase [candidate division WS1 bacterium]
MIEGVALKSLNVHADERGYLMEIFRDDDELFERFGQVYMTTCYPGIVKAWHAHTRQHDNVCCVAGSMRLGLFDDRADSPTQRETMSLILGLVHPVLVHIPPGVWHGFTPAGPETATMVNVPTQHYDYAEPDELRRDPFDPDIPFDWLIRGG